MSLLFQPIQFGTLKLSNKIIIAPMCQYSATGDGEVTFWHEQQWAKYALSGAGLTIVEATAVQPEGRISHADLGLWNNLQAEKMKLALNKVKAISSMPFAIQLAHAGRKASTDYPWTGKGQLSPQDALGWQIVSASDLAFNETDHAPHALTIDEIQKIIQDFADAAKRVVDVDFDLIELHAAHGYLLHQFLSPISNKRTDEYGGSFENRIRLTLEVFQAIKNVVPENYPVGIRISATDWMDDIDSWNVESSVELSKALEALGAVYIHVSSGGLDAKQKIDIHSCYQVPFAHSIKKAVNISVIAVGLITEPMQAEGVLQYEQADAIGIARSILYQPHWPWQAAAELGATVAVSPQYLRCQPHGLKDVFTSF